MPNEVMPSYEIIGALTALANAANPGDSLLALDHARSLLGREIEAYQQLLDSLARRTIELDRLRTLARYDTLTGIYNRRTFEEAFDREFARLHRNGDLFSLVFIDLDGLKQINDCWGHPMGDHALKTVARECSNNIRSTDIAARLGGDEFAIILIGSDTSNARTFTGRLRTAVERHSIGDKPIGVSVGVASATTSATSAEEIFSEADADLYRDKANRSGRKDIRPGIYPRY